MSKKEAYKTMQLLMPNKRYDLFIDLDDIDIDAGKQVTIK